MTSIVIGRAGEPGLGAPLLDSMYRLRCAVFHERLRWSVHVEHGREHDWFDLIGPHYLIAHQNASVAFGCCRLLPTTGPNMLRDIFPFLIESGRAPASPAIWEVSRFAIDPRASGEGFGFGAIAAGMLAEMFRFSGARQVETLVGVTSAPVERLLRHLGLVVERLGPPQRIGEVMSLAFRMPVAENLRVVGPGQAAGVQRAA